MSWSNEDVIKLLELDVPAYERKVHAVRARGVARAYADFLKTTGRTPSEIVRGGLERSLSGFLVFQCTEFIEAIEALNGLLGEYNLRYMRAVSDREREDHVLAFARALGADEAHAGEDRKAFARWFGFDAVRERCHRRMAEHEYAIQYNLSRLGVIAAHALKVQDISTLQQEVWDSLNLGKFLVDLLSYDGDSRIRVEAFRTLAKTIKVLRPDVQDNRIDAHTVMYVYRFAVDGSEDVWPQCEALSLLEELSLDDLSKALINRFETPEEDGDIFVRRRAAVLVGKHADASPDFAKALALCMGDPSPFVRIGLAQALPATEIPRGVETLRHLALKDQAYQVRAAAAYELSRFIDEKSVHDVAAVWLSLLSDESNAFVLRATLEAVCCSCEAWSEQARDTVFLFAAELLLPAMAVVHSSASDYAVRRYAAQAQERLFLLRNAEAVALKKELTPLVRNIKPGKYGRIPGKLVKGREDLFGRVLSVMARDDFGFTVKKGLRGYRLYRGSDFEFQYWRMTYEMFNPSPDKRQAFRHTVGRKLHGQMIVPSAILSEQTRTKVPGEPLHMSQEGGWRPYLPLPGEALASLGQTVRALPVKTYTAEGMTVLTPPRSPFRRCWAALKLMLGFARYSDLRNWTEKSGQPPTAYVESLQGLGFQVELQGYDQPVPEGSPDPSVKRFFPVVIPFFDADWWLGVREYFFSAYGNSLYELGLFSGLVLCGFALHRAFLHRRALRSRARLPLVIGGWGTRGKSGVERLKAAMFEGRGHSLVSKTTGCEALFLHSYAFGKTHEMFLFRPYDKATIWEHHRLMDRAGSLGAEVFLWECMGLTPSYVRILQRNWSRDDYSTITNTYPDHEDIQGPAGINIPQVMTNFVPDDGMLITSEEEMTPIIADAAHELGTELRRVSWLDAGLLTDDVLQRFPYSEHPSNIALVLKLAEELGIDRDYALKEMADRVIPDIGVLKTFPVARVKDRRLQFVNGMSANERFATLANWRRMGFADTNLDNDPDVFITTVVNNRADRLSRSRMFASILVDDLSADKHVLIGTNLGGLQGYITRAFNESLKGLRLGGGDQGNSPEEILFSTARRMRIPTSGEQLRGRLNAVLRGISVSDELPQSVDPANDAEVLAWIAANCPDSVADAASEHMKTCISYYKDYSLLRDKIRQGGGALPKGLDKEFHELLRRCFFDKIIVINDQHASGDEIISVIADATPPGLLNRIMGLQNIKGTGLDFMYCWQAWETCYNACKGMLDGDEKTQKESLEALFSFQEYGLLSEQMVLETIDAGRHEVSFQAERAQAALTFIQSNLAKAMTAIHASLGVKRKKGIAVRLLEAAEAFLDAGDAIRRRKTARAIYRDLENQRISHERATLELKFLNKQQKGGWLHDRIFSPLSRKLEN